MDYNNMALDHGRTDFDRRHNSVTSILFHPDFFTNTPYLVVTR